MLADSAVPPLRIDPRNDAPLRRDGTFVLYWMTASRRLHFNYGLERAVEWARELERPLVVLEALRAGYRWASDRLHAFVLQGMADNQRAFGRTRSLYYPYVELRPGEGKGLVEALASRACVVVTDDFPCFFLPRMLNAVAPRLEVRCEAIDSNGLMPLRVADRTFPTAYAFRRFLQRELPSHLDNPKRNALARVQLPVLAKLPKEIRQRWPCTSPELLRSPTKTLSALSIDHSVRPVEIAGGHSAAAAVLKRFVSDRLERYCEARNDPAQTVSSQLSPYLHFGHISTHEVFTQLVRHESWSPSRLGGTANGKREDWWGMSAPSEAFLDQLVTWRELGFNSCAQRPDYERYESLPAWALKTLQEHASDERPHLYELGDFEHSETHDPLWNAAQRQLVQEGTIHNYLRMLWGKKIVEWTRTPEHALEIMIELNNKYALDGRNPNSYSGIFWVLGRYDRPWGPERPVFGKVRYMTSQNTARKIKVAPYMEKYGETST